MNPLLPWFPWLIVMGTVNIAFNEYCGDRLSKKHPT